MSEYWISVKICKGTAGSTYGRAYKIEGSETFADLIEKLSDVENDQVSKVELYLAQVPRGSSKTKKFCMPKLG